MAVENGDIISVDIKATLDDGTKVLNRKTFEASFENAQTSTAVLAAIELWVEELYGNLVTCIPAQTTMDVCEASIIVWNATEEKWETSISLGQFTPTVTFTGAGDQLPNQCAAFVIGKTYRPKSKGRIFAFPFDEGTQEHGELLPAFFALLGDFAVDYLADQVISAGNLLLSGIVRVAVGEFWDFISAEANDIIGTQRSRRFGVGT